MPSEYIGQDRYHPDGSWVQTSHLETVAGVQFRKKELAEFIRAVRVAERLRKPYGLKLEREADNPDDHNAIAVYGVCEQGGLFGPRGKRWHIGYVPRDLAGDLTNHLISAGVPIAAELYSIVVTSDEYVDVKFIVLAPPGYGVNARRKLAHPPGKGVNETTEDDLIKLYSLVGRLNSDEVLSDDQISRLIKKSMGRRRFLLKEWADGGGPHPDERLSDLEDENANIDNDLRALVDKIDAEYTKYIETADIPSSYYPLRVAIILRKLRRKTDELQFLAAWCRHFAGSGRGGGYKELVVRAGKLGTGK